MMLKKRRLWTRYKDSEGEDKVREHAVVWKECGFGDMLQFDMPEGCNVVILCESSGTGMKPKRVLLPHQVYRETIAEHGNDVVLVPARCEDYIHVELPDVAARNRS